MSCWREIAEGFSQDSRDVRGYLEIAGIARHLAQDWQDVSCWLEMVEILVQDWQDASCWLEIADSPAQE